MPELPEVETIKNDLSPLVKGLRFTGVSLTWPRMVLGPSVEEFCRRLPGKKIDGLTRKGKYLIFRLDSGEALVLHFRMTGSLLLRDRKNGLNLEVPYVTAIFGLEDGRELVFSDRRKLGTAMLTKDEGIIDNKLGPEPLDGKFTPAVLESALRNRKAPIKAVLCEQKIIAGIGNMYADEALFTANINPLRAANSLSKREIKRLHEAIRRTLNRGISNAGATFSDYRRPNGNIGNQQNDFYVAHRRGEVCKVCSCPIERIPVRNRGTYYCPECQPE